MTNTTTQDTHKTTADRLLIANHNMESAILDGFRGTAELWLNEMITLIYILEDDLDDFTDSITKTH